MTQPVLSLWGAAPSLLIMRQELAHISVRCALSSAEVLPKGACLFTIDNSAMQERDQVSRTCEGIKWELGEHGSTVYS